MLNRRPAWAEVDLDAVAANVRALVATAAPAAVCAVVKADGYGHGAVPVAEAALAAGASWLGVAMSAEAAPLRAAGIDAPILLLAEPAPAEVDDAVALRVRPTVYTRSGIDGVADAAARAGAPAVPVHLKVDTGMHRVGAEPAGAPALAAAALRRPELVLEGVWTHCAVADEPGNPFTVRQAERFEAVLAELRSAGVRPALVHAANSAAALDHPRLRHDLVRCGITVYGLEPSPALHDRIQLRPALSLRARVSLVKVVPAGEGVSYGLRYRRATDSVVATVPLGYADGVPRRLSAVGGEVLLGGRRRPLAGTVTMDQILVDCGPAGEASADSVRCGDEVVLLGEQGGERIGAEEWAARLDTIPYEVVCGISPRVPRRYRRSAGLGGEHG
ncbi:MAG: alanine racemase [Actinomycetota bacterium]|nr:alanine racemase [Actinomycetota bacterium]